jgi:hypothetical protein
MPLWEAGEKVRIEDKDKSPQQNVTVHYSAGKSHGPHGQNEGLWHW